MQIHSYHGSQISQPYFSGTLVTCLENDLERFITKVDWDPHQTQIPTNLGTKGKGVPFYRHQT